jgi:putative AlgH/UPF0301 family transcriptional regulator
MKLARKSSDKKRSRGYLDGQMLIATPTMQDERFARSLIYLCAHSSEGAMGIIVNHPAANINFPDLLVQLDVIPADELIQLPEGAETMKVLKGGPVETGRGFVLHSADFFIENSTLPIDEGVCLTARQRARKRSAGPRLRRMGAWPIGDRNPVQRLVTLCGRSGVDFRGRHRGQISPRLAQNRHRDRQPLKRSRTCLTLLRNDPETMPAAPFPV